MNPFTTSETWWSNDNILHIKSWNNFISISYPYNRIISETQCKINNKIMWFYNESLNFDCRKILAEANSILGDKYGSIDKKTYLTDPVSCLIDWINNLSITRKTAKNLFPNLTDHGNIKTDLIHTISIIVHKRDRKQSYIDNNGIYIVHGINEVIRSNHYAYIDAICYELNGIEYSKLDILNEEIQKYKQKDFSKIKIYSVIESEYFIEKSSRSISKKKYKCDYAKIASNNEQLFKYIIHIIGIIPISDDKSPIKQKRKKAIHPKIREAVWRKHNDASLDGKCYVCDRNISYNDWHCGHIIAEANGGNASIDNLQPVCKHCNLNMGIMNMNDYKIYYNKNYNK